MSGWCTCSGCSHERPHHAHPEEHHAHARRGIRAHAPGDCGPRRTPARQPLSHRAPADPAGVPQNERGKSVNDATVKRGRRFFHTRWLDPSKGYDSHVPALFEITAIRRGLVYFRPVYTYDDGSITRESLGSGFYAPLSTFEAQDVKQWVS